MNIYVNNYCRTISVLFHFIGVYLLEDKSKVESHIRLWYYQQKLTFFNASVNVFDNRSTG